MRNKNTIIALLVIFTAICFFNLFMTYRAFSLEAELNAATPERAEAMRREEGFKEAYEFAQRNAFSLGLDLQGGLFVTMEVGVEDILREYAGGSADADFEKALKRAIEEKVNSQDNLVDLFAKNLEAVYKEAGRPIPLTQGSGTSILLARYFASQARGIDANFPDDKVRAKLKEDTEAAIQNAYTIIRSRIDQFGVASPNLQLQSGTGRILLELPGVKDPNRVKRLIQNSAKLEFRETVAYSDAIGTISEVDKVVKRIMDREAGITPAETDSTQTESDGMTTPPDSGGTASTVGDSTEGAPADSQETSVSDLFKGKKDSATASSDSAGDSTAATAGNPEDIEKFKKDHPFLSLFDLKAPFATADKPLIGLVSLSDTSVMNRWLNHPEVKAIIPYYLKFLWESKVDDGRGQEYKNKLGLIAIRSNREDKAKLEGNVIVG
ncbi:MAG: hypothetical protein RLZZ165_2337, partial [Bacteroidota bacterium]